MKQLFTTTILLTLLIGTALGQKPIHKFIDQHKDDDHSIAMTIPGWLIRSGMNFAEKFSEDEDEKIFLSLGQYIKKLRFLAIEEKAQIDQEDIDWLLRSMKKDNMEEYVRVKDEGKNVNIWMHEKDQVIKNLTIMAREDDSFVIATLKTDLPLSVFEEANFSFNKKK